ADSQDHASGCFSIGCLKCDNYCAILLLFDALPIFPVILCHHPRVRTKAKAHLDCRLKKWIACEVGLEVEIDRIGKCLIQHYQLDNAIQAEGADGWPLMTVADTVLPAPARHQLVRIKLARRRCGLT